MNKLYGDKRQLAIHSRHASNRQSPAFNTLLKRQQSASRVSRSKREQSATRISKTKLHDDKIREIDDTENFRKRNSVVHTINNNWMKPKTR
mgnify:CR=1 FL=1